MSSGTATPLRESGLAIRLPRFESTPECTMPRGDGPCERTECRYHLANRQRGEHQLDPSRDCALVVANEGEHTLEEVARISGLTREWVRQLEGKALAKLARSPNLRAIHHDPRSVRRAAFAIAREHATRLAVPLRVAFDDSLRGDLARLRLLARLRTMFPGTPARALDELIRGTFTP